MKPTQIANAVKIAQSLAALTDDETAVFQGTLAAATDVDYKTGQLSRFANVKEELAVVVSLFTKLAAIPALAAAA